MGDGWGFEETFRKYQGQRSETPGTSDLENVYPDLQRACAYAREARVTPGFETCKYIFDERYRSNFDSETNKLFRMLELE